MADWGSFDNLALQLHLKRRLITKGACISIYIRPDCLVTSSIGHARLLSCRPSSPSPALLWKRRPRRAIRDGAEEGVRSGRLGSQPATVGCHGGLDKENAAKASWDLRYSQAFGVFGGSPKIRELRLGWARFVGDGELRLRCGDVRGPRAA